MIIKLSDTFNLRPQQRELLQEFFYSKRRYFVRVAHRRFGKDFEAFALMYAAAMQRVGIYLYLLPTINQSRNVIWQTIGEDGTKLIDRVHEDLVAKRNESEQKIVLKNGSIIYVSGSDNFKRLIGMNAAGIVFSEYQDSSTLAYQSLSPMIARNQGWVLFNGTPRAYNHFSDLYNDMKDNKDWYVTNLTCNDTYDNNGERIITSEMIEQERSNGMPEELIQQEYFGSWAAALRGAYYAEALRICREENRIGNFPFVDLYPVYTGWDLGVRDRTAIWFVQVYENKVHLIDYYENDSNGMQHYVDIINQRKLKFKYRYSTHFAPHDIEVREFGSGKSRISQAREMGLQLRTVQRVANKIEGIQAVRYMFKRFHFNEVTARQGLKHLHEYHASYNAKADVYSVDAVHNKASHGADALQTFALGWLKQFEQAELANQIRYANLYSKNVTSLR